MCVFSRAVRHVGKTKIFVGHRAGGEQALVYAMEVEVDEPTAMVLPLPTPAGCGEDAVRFVSLEAYPTLFADLEAAFPALGVELMPQALGRRNTMSVAPTLKVHKVGAFVASFAPTADELDRLDPQFRLSAAARAAVTADRDGWSYAVVQLAERGRRSVHPIALVFPRRDPSLLYVPTVHVHGDRVETTAGFDHTIYYQPDAVVAATTPSTPAKGPISASVALDRTEGLVADAPTFAMALRGRLANDDVWIGAPGALTLDDVSARGAAWEVRLGVQQGYDLAPGAAARRHRPEVETFADSAPPHLPHWHRTARTRGPAIAAALRGWCQAFVAAHAAEVTRLTPELPAHYFNGDTLWSVEHGATLAAGPAAIDFRPWSPRAEFQRVVIGFARMPDRLDARRWRDELVRILDTATA